jgi:hypothetical protein
MARSRSRGKRIHGTAPPGRGSQWWYAAAESMAAAASKAAAYVYPVSGLLRGDPAERAFR